MNGIGFLTSPYFRKAQEFSGATFSRMTNPLPPVIKLVYGQTALVYARNHSHSRR